MEDKGIFIVFVLEHVRQYLDDNREFKAGGSLNEESRIFTNLLPEDKSAKESRKTKVTTRFLRRCIDEWLKDTIDNPTPKDIDRWYDVARGLLLRRNADGRPTQNPCTPDDNPISFFIAGQTGINRPAFYRAFKEAQFQTDDADIKTHVTTLQKSLGKKAGNSAQITMSTIKGLLPKYQGTVKTLRENGYTESEADEIAFRLVRPFVSATNVATRRWAEEKGLNIVGTDTLTTTSLDDFHQVSQHVAEQEAKRTIRIIGAFGKESDAQTQAIFNAISTGKADLPGMDIVVNEDLKTPSVLMFRDSNKIWQVTRAGRTLGLGQEKGREPSAEQTLSS